MNLNQQVQQALDKNDDILAFSLIVNKYNQDTNNKISLPISEPEEVELIRWLYSLKSGHLISLNTATIFLRKYFYTESCLKRYLQQAKCSMCNRDSMTLFSIRISPASYQMKSAYKKEFQRQIRKHEHFKSGESKYLDATSVFVKLVFTINSGRNKDLDNMAKITLDALKDIAFGDDININHLELIKVFSNDEEDHISVQISDCPINDKFKVLFNRNNTSWGSNEKITFRD